jgi:hypothetical protein
LRAFLTKNLTKKVRAFTEQNMSVQVRAFAVMLCSAIDGTRPNDHWTCAALGPSLSVWSARSRDFAGKQQMVVAWSGDNQRPHGNPGRGTNLKDFGPFGPFFPIFPGLPLY